MTPLSSCAEHHATIAKQIRHNAEYMPKELQEQQLLEAQKHEEWAVACRKTLQWVTEMVLHLEEGEKLMDALLKENDSLQRALQTLEGNLAAGVGICCSNYPKCSHQQQRIREGKV